MLKEKIIIKIGTATLSAESGINTKIIETLSNVVSRLRKAGYKIVLVTSGAVGLGVKELKLLKKPRTVSEKQMAASIGQVKLMETYERYFSKHKITIAQILLTRDGFEQKEVYRNARETLNSLLAKGIIPIINENDAVASEEIKFGDNDMLSAMVGELIHAKRLIILTDEEGLYDKNPKTNKDAKLISIVKNITKKIERMTAGKGSELSMGGMRSKLQAAKLASSCGIKTHIIHGKTPTKILEVLKGKNIGTTFL